MSTTSTRQSTVLLSFMETVFNTLATGDMLMELREDVLQGKELVLATAKLFPEDGNSLRNFLWSKEKVSEVAFLINHAGTEYSEMDLVTLAEFITYDMLEEITSPVLRHALDHIRVVLGTISNHMDPEGTAYESFDGIKEVLAVIYGIIGFTLEGRYLKHQEKLARRARRHGSTT